MNLQNSPPMGYWTETVQSGLYSFSPPKAHLILPNESFCEKMEILS